MSDVFSKKVIAFLSIVFMLFSINVIGQQQSIISKKEYKNIIVKGFYTFQNEENAQFLDSILTIIRLNRFTIKEDSINSKILYLK